MADPLPYFSTFVLSGESGADGKAVSDCFGVCGVIRQGNGVGSVLWDWDDLAFSGAAGEAGVWRRGCTGGDCECEGECPVERDQECGVFLRQGGRGNAWDGEGEEGGCGRDRGRSA